MTGNDTEQTTGSMADRQPTDDRLADLERKVRDLAAELERKDRRIDAQRERIEAQSRLIAELRATSERKRERIADLEDRLARLEAWTGDRSAAPRTAVDGE